MFVQMLVCILLVEFAGPYFIRTAEHARLVWHTALGGSVGCGSYLAMSIIAQNSKNYDVMRVLASMNGFMSLYLLATIAALYFVIQSRLNCHQRMVFLAVAAGFCGYGITTSM
jgi:hypothetical protein